MPSPSDSGPLLHTYRSSRPPPQESRADPSSSLVWLTGAKLAPTRLPLACALTLRRRIMGAKTSDGVIVGIWAVVAAAVYAVLWVAQGVLSDGTDDDYWLSDLTLNLLGYSTVFLPGYAVIRYVREKNYVETASKTLLYPVVKLIVFGSGGGEGQTIDDSIEADAAKQSQEQARPKNEREKAKKLVICFVGLQVSYLTWGVLQEKIMTRQYVDSTGNTGQFKNSQFLVFVNRILAFTVALTYITLGPAQPRHRAPLYKYSYSSFSNIMSSWFQYEALKFVSFPTQVLTKASKIIPVMIMGKVVSARKYETYEYVVALLISVGMTLFLFGSQADRADSSGVTTFTGVILLVGYMMFDAFTSTWQNELFSVHKMSSVQMMCGVNFFSVVLTSSSLLQQGTFYTSLVFMSQFPPFVFDCVLLSLCSACGQLFIFYTISEFGAIVFVIISTLRQAMAILLSCLIYGHPVTAIGVLGVLVVFGAIYLKVYCGQKMKKLKQHKTSVTDSNVTKA